MEQVTTPALIIFHSKIGGSNSTLTLAFFFISLAIFHAYWSKFGGKGNRKLDDDDKKTLPGLDILPGPSSWDPTGIVGNGLQLLPFEKTSENLLQWSERYGDIFKFVFLNRTWVVLNSGPTVQSLLKSADSGHHMKCMSFYGLAKPFINNGVIMSSGEFCQGQRKLLLKSQSYANLKAFMPTLNKHCKKFVSGLESLFQDGKPHQVHELISSSFIKIICEMITGSGDGKREEYVDYHHNLHSWVSCAFYRIQNPWLLVDRIWKLHPLSWKNSRLVEKLLEFARRRIREHQQKRQIPDKKSDSSETASFRSVLDDLVDAGVEERQIVDEINTMIFAGHDTTATGIHFFLFSMASNPDIQTECQKEVDKLFENPQSLKDGMVTFEAASSSLKLVERCVLETLRLFSPAIVMFRTLETPLKTSYDEKDVVIPVGTNIIASPYLLHKNPAYFPNPEKFDPDRFLPEETAKRHAYTYIPFSAGARNCLGLKFAMIEMKIIAAYVLRHFSITTTDKIEDIPLLPFVTLTPAKDFTFHFTKRDVQHLCL